MRPEFALALTLFGMALIKRRVICSINAVVISFVVFGCVIVLSCTHAVFALQSDLAISDIYEVFKVGIYIIVYLASTATTWSTKRDEGMIWLILYSFLASSVAGICQYYNIMSINESVTPIYAPTQLRGVQEYGRVVGTTANPNDYAIMMLLGSLVALALTLWSKKRAIKWTASITLAAAIICILLTTSRAAIFVLPLALGLIIKMAYQESGVKRTRKSRVFAISTAIGMLLVGVISVMPESWYWRMISVIEYAEDVSLNARLVNWEVHSTLWLESPLFGMGPGKGIISYNVDNEWLLLLVRYGVVGVAAIVGVGRTLYRLAGDALDRNEAMEVKAVNASLRVFLIAASIVMMTGGVYHNQQTMSILLIMYGWAQSHADSDSCKEVGATGKLCATSGARG